ncbi:MAG: YkvA family protein [Alphaproteobacteria bacterium]
MPEDDQEQFDLDKLRKDEKLVRERFWDKLHKTLGRVPFMEDALAAYYCAMDSKTPTYVRAVLLGALAYFIMPFDVIPDIILGFGFTDDASVLIAAIAAVRSALAPEHFGQARAFLDKTAPGEDEEKEED